MIIEAINQFLRSYEYNSISDFMLSMMPSKKYGMMSLSITFSSIVGFMGQYLGFGPLVAVAMLVAIALEIGTGLYASHIAKIPFQSHLFSRCVIKIFIWVGLIFVANSFEMEYCAKNGPGTDSAYFFFGVVKIGIMMLFVIENVTSILENLAIIEGKPKDHYIGGIKDILSQGFTLLKGLFIK